LVIGVFGLIGLAMLPWTIWLASSLKPHQVTERWDLAWSGFDTALAVAFLLTAFAAWQRSPWVGALAAATGTLLVTDAWFDIVLESHSDQLRKAIFLAVFAELPLAALCFWIAYRTERFLALIVEQVLHLAAAAESTTERDLIGVLEVTPDGQATREPRDADPTA
jgi:4-amino-4-deoxy-L-arabinose transferase-like glycosyltransferase